MPHHISNTKFEANCDGEIDFWNRAIPEFLL